MAALIVSVILSSIVIIAGAIGMIGLGTVQGVVQFVFGLLWLGITILRIVFKKPVKGEFATFLAGRLLVFAILIGFGFLFVSPIIKGFAFQYPFKMRYVANYGYENEIFPEELPKRMGDYQMNFTPSILQGSGWTNVNFRTDAETIAMYRSELEAAGCEAEALGEHGAYELLRSHLPEDINANLKECEIYTTRFDDDWNHSRLTCMVVNERKGFVMFFEM